MIAKAGKPLAKVVALDAPEPRPPKRLGVMAGESAIPDDFDRMAETQIEGMLSGHACSCRWTDPRRLRRVWRTMAKFDCPINSDQALAVAALPDDHKAPQDRMLIAQAKVEEIILLTSDVVVASYRSDRLRETCL